MPQDFALVLLLSLVAGLLTESLQLDRVLLSAWRSSWAFARHFAGAICPLMCLVFA